MALLDETTVEQHRSDRSHGAWRAHAEQICICANGAAGPYYALLGYSWAGCTNGQQMRPRAREWDEDFGEPVGGAACKERAAGVYVREWTGATVLWDCSVGHGKIVRK